MPLEGHWERQNTRLRQLTTRERAALLAGSVLTVAAIATLILAFAGDSQPPPGPGCIRAKVAHVMGAEELNACGVHARHICAGAAADTDPNALAIQAACRNAGVSTAKP